MDLANKGEIDSALDLLNQIQAQAPTEPRVLRALGVLFANKGDLKKSVHLLRGSISGDPNQDTVREFAMVLLRAQASPGDGAATRAELARLLVGLNEANLSEVCDIALNGIGENAQRCFAIGLNEWTMYYIPYFVL